MGESLSERCVTCPSLYPESITVFKEPLENACDTPEELAEEIDITIMHEVAHFSASVKGARESSGMTRLPWVRVTRVLYRVCEAKPKGTEP